MVNIFVQVNGEWIRALEIPPDDIRRLSIRPLKWLRFATFAALGARGDLLDAPGGNVVNYATEHDDLGEFYYFQHSDPQHIVDNRGLDDRTNSLVTCSSEYCCCGASFHNRIAERDGNCCVITRGDADMCKPTHIIPHAKGDAYIQSVIQDRRNIYQDEWAVGYPASDIDIDATQNGVFFGLNLHRKFGIGHSSLLRTPNFALDTDDIPRVDSDSDLSEGPLASRTTLQHIISDGPKVLWQVPQFDVGANWSGENAPSTVLLDYAYGVAVMKSWATVDIQQVLNDRHNTGYNFASNTVAYAGEGKDQFGGQTSGIHYRSDSDSPGRMSRSRAMDFVLELSLMMRGYPAGTTAEGFLQKQEEEAKVHSQKVSREKVQGWLQEGHDTTGN